MNLLLIISNRYTYSKPIDEPSNLSGCIENFLSQDILANPVVTSSKLTVNEAAQLEAPLSLYELDEAAKH